MGLGSHATVIHMMKEYNSKVDEFRARDMLAELTVMAQIGCSCEDFFERKNAVANMPLREYVDSLVALIGEV